MHTLRVANLSIDCEIWWKLISIQKTKKNNTINWSLFILLYVSASAWKSIHRIFCERARTSEHELNNIRLEEAIKVRKQPKKNIQKHALFFVRRFTMLRKNSFFSRLNCSQESTYSVCLHHEHNPGLIKTEHPEIPEHKPEYSQFYANIFAFFLLHNFVWPTIAIKYTRSLAFYRVCGNWSKRIIKKNWEKNIKKWIKNAYLLYSKNNILIEACFSFQSQKKRGKTINRLLWSAIWENW